MDKQAIVDQVERVISSSAFNNKRQLQELLRFLSSHIDEQSTLKPDRICRFIWADYSGKNPSADLAPVISRLRSALESFYVHEGGGDQVLIRLPDRSGRSGLHSPQAMWIVAEERTPAEADRGGHFDAVPLTARYDSEALAHANGIGSSKLPISETPGRFWVFAFSITCLLGMWVWIKDRPAEPRGARFDGSTFSVLDARGRELWKVTFSEGFSGNYYESGVSTRTWFGDLDGSGHNSVLFLYQPAIEGANHSTTLICYSHWGREQWRWSPGRALPQLPNEPAVYVITGLAVLEGSRSKPPRIVVASRHFPYYPSQIALLDVRGHMISEYWHSGHLDYMALTRPDANGRQDIVASGISNGYHQATLVVLDPDHLSGASREIARPELQLQGTGTSSEKLRLLFPRTDFNVATEPYNAGQEITVADDGIRVSVLECLSNSGYRVWYTFDKNFQLVSVHVDDQFRMAHDRYYREIGEAHKFTPEEEAQFEEVRCLVGCSTSFLPKHTSKNG